MAIVQTYIMVHVNFLTKSSSNNKSKNLDFFKHQKTETSPYCHKILSMSKKKTSNQTVISNKYSVLIGRFLSTGTKLILESFMTVKSGMLFL